MPKMLRPTFISLLLHVVIGVVFIFGIPFFGRAPNDAEPLVFITIVDEIPVTNQPAPSAKAKKQSEEMQVTSKTPPAPSQKAYSPPPKSQPETKPIKSKKEVIDLASDISSPPAPIEKSSVILPETSADNNALEVPVKKPKAAPEKVDIAAPIKRPEIPNPQKKPISRPDQQPEKKSVNKKPVSKPKVPTPAQQVKTTTRDLLKPLLDATPTVKPAQQPSRDNALSAKKPTKEPDNTMNGVLQNLAQASAATDQKIRSQAPVRDKQTLDAQEINDTLQNSLQVNPTKSTKLGASEIDRLRMHISRCWSPPAAAPNAEKLAVDVRVRADSDGTVTSVESQDPDRFKVDGFYRVAARAAVRAVEECSPLPLPAEKHESWKDFIFHFDPKFISG